MATRFEIILHSHQRKDWLQSVAEEILDEIDRIESQPAATCPPVNRASQSTRCPSASQLDPQVFQLLEDCIQWHQQTREPSISLQALSSNVGGLPMDNIVSPPGIRLKALEQWHSSHPIGAWQPTISFDTDGVTLDLGAVGKGYAMETRRFWQTMIESAILHGAQARSARLTPPDDVAWHVGIVRPEKDLASPFADRSATAQPSSVSDLLTSVALTDASLSISAVWGKSFRSGDRTFAILSIHEMATLFPISGSPSCMKTLFPVMCSPAMLVEAHSSPKICPSTSWKTMAHDPARREKDT